jgi:hypothetical protein
MKYTRNMKAYRVTVESTNAMRDTTRTRRESYFPYLPCKNSEVIVVTGDPKLIFDVFHVVKLEAIAPGYYLEELNP